MRSRRCHPPNCSPAQASLGAPRRNGGGDAFPVRAPWPDGTHSFLLQNDYVATNGAAANLVTEPQFLPINYQP